MIRANQKTTVAAVATLAGTIIGVGLFSLPYIANRVGILTMLIYFVILSAVVILMHLMFGEAVLRTKKLCRFPGYAEKYLGKWGKRLSFLSSILGISGANLAYLIVGGGFLYSLFNSSFGGGMFLYVLIFFAAGAFLIYAGIKDISKTEFFLLVVFFAILAAIFYKGFSLIQIHHLFNFNIRDIFLPYGAILFSLSGLSLVPEIKEMLSRRPADLKKVIIISVLIAAISYLIFIFLILGLTGPQTSTEAISGLKAVFGNGLVVLTFVLGVLTTFTSFITLGLTVKKIFWYDLRINKNISWALACFIPFCAYLLGLKNFIATIGFTGAVFGGISSILIILIYLKAKTKGDKSPAYHLSLPRFVIYSLVLLFALGILYQIWYFIV